MRMVRKDRDPQGKQALAAGSPQELRVAWKYRVLRYSRKGMVARRSAQGAGMAAQERALPGTPAVESAGPAQCTDEEKQWPRPTAWRPGRPRARGVP